MSAKTKKTAADLPLHDLVPSGNSLVAKISSSEELEKVAKLKNLVGRIWRISIEEGGQTYSADCILQTKGWKPKKNDPVSLVRQSENVGDHYFFAFRLEE